MLDGGAYAPLPSAAVAVITMTPVTPLVSWLISRTTGGTHMLRPCGWLENASARRVPCVATPAAAIPVEVLVNGTLPFGATVCVPNALGGLVAGIGVLALNSIPLSVL